eukprot:NODE_10266_length_528_cov_15.271605_g9619_i0.p1 GENE.NODE_10266_length_528_cov_15.271605_g9619_i0~~NODE_10266_length_528_cov_15.271605_g9619_i0.p1  ORF type:complete len:135 (-),score=15.09 NODE_10266_length_528_cov_15.271605_g9619_i0:123-488(-)
MLAKALLLVAFFAFVSCQVGGLQGELRVNNDVAKIVNNLKGQIKQKAQSKGLNGDFAVFFPLTYKTQVVAGTNYFVKIQFNNSPVQYLHAKIFVPLPYVQTGPRLVDIKIPVQGNVPLNYF